MNDIQLKLAANGRGEFVIENNDAQKLAEMVIAVSGEKLTVFHTEVNEALKGQGVASKLMDAMIAYVRANKLKVIPLCVFVLAQFKRHPEKYADIWDQDWHKNSK